MYVTSFLPKDGSFARMTWSWNSAVRKESSALKQVASAEQNCGLCSCTVAKPSNPPSSAIQQLSSDSSACVTFATILPSFGKICPFSSFIRSCLVPSAASSVLAHLSTRRRWNTAGTGTEKLNRKQIKEERGWQSSTHLKPQRQKIEEHQLNSIPDKRRAIPALTWRRTTQIQAQKCGENTNRKPRHVNARDKLRSAETLRM